MRLRKPSPSMVVAVAAVVIACIGTSYAAVKISGSDIKNRSIAGKKLKRNTLTGKQVNESRLRIPGLIGGTIPSGKTVTGVIVVGSVVNPPPATSVGAQDSASFPGRAPQPLVSTDIVFGAGAGGVSVDPRCTGSAANPTAPADVVCIYPTAVGTGTSVTPFAVGGENSPASQYGFGVILSDAGGDPTFNGVWAYRAP